MAARIYRTLSSPNYFVSQFLKKSFPFNIQQCSASSNAPITSTSTAKVEGGTSSSYSSEKTTHFGFKTVTEEEKKNKGSNNN